MKYIVYATGEKGQGHVQEIGRFDDLDDIEIRIELFTKDVVITIEQEKEENDKSFRKG